jgi:uncharacterized protein YraI
MNMKKILIASVLLALCAAASAMTFYSGGVLMGTVCRNGPYYTDYAGVSSLPVGAPCYVRAGGNPYAPIIGGGIVTTE